MRSRAVALALAVALLPGCTDGGRTAAPSPLPTTSPTGSTTPSQTTPAEPLPTAEPPRPLPAGFVPQAVWFETRQRGWALGGGDGITRVAGTTNGGRTWSLLGAIPVQAGDSEGRAHVSRLRFGEGADGWAYGSVSYTTYDEGRTWYPYGGSSGLSVVSVGSSTRGTVMLLGVPDEAVAREAEVRVSDGGGLSRLDRAGVDAAADDSLVAEFQTIAFRTADGRLRVSTSHGQAWTTRGVCPDRLVDLATAANPEAGYEHEMYLLCDGSLRHSRDGGETVTRRSGAVGSFTEVAAGWAGTVVLAGPTLATSANGGRTLRTVPAPADTLAWTDPRMVDASFGTVVRIGRTTRELWVTNDAGRTWRPMPIR